MIRPLRARHRHLFALLLPLLPALYLGGLVARPPSPTMAVLPSGLTDAGTAAIERGRFDELWPEHGLRIIVSWPPPVLVVETAAIVPSPDLLVYVAPTAAPSGAPLPAESVLLGAVGEAGSRAFTLRDIRLEGHVVFYSLGHGASLGSVALGEVAVAAATSAESE